MTELLIAFAVWAILILFVFYLGWRHAQYKANILPIYDQDIEKAVQDAFDRDKIAKQESQSVAKDIASGKQWKDCWCVQDWKNKHVLCEGGEWGDITDSRFRVLTFTSYEEAWAHAKVLMIGSPYSRLEAKPLRHVPHIF